MPAHRIVLTFHGIGDPPSYADPVDVPYWVSRESFAEFASRAADRDDVRLTFDDGYISDLREALPVLVRHNIRASFAISVRCIGRRGYLDRLGIRELVDAGMTIMSHGVEHRSWTELENTELIRQALDSRRTLQDITESPVTDAACPYGAYDARVLTTLRQTGTPVSTRATRASGTVSTASSLATRSCRAIRSMTRSTEPERVIRAFAACSGVSAPARSAGPRPAETEQVAPTPRPPEVRGRAATARTSLKKRFDTPDC